MISYAKDVSSGQSTEFLKNDNNITVSHLKKSIERNTKFKAEQYGPVKR